MSKVKNKIKTGLELVLQLRTSNTLRDRKQRKNNLIRTI